MQGMEEEILSITESYEATVRQALLKGLRAMKCKAQQATNRIKQETGMTTLLYPRPYTMFWLTGKSPDEPKRPICLVSQEMSEATGYAGEGRNVKVYYGSWAQYVFKPMREFDGYSFAKPYQL